jgi:uncharacterized protein (DUF486 family)
VKTIGLLFASNVFMTAAWYGHLRFKSSPLWKAILFSWLIAFFEYCLQVPANFAAFAWLWLGERLRWNEAAAFALVLAAVVVTSLP